MSCKNCYKLVPIAKNVNYCIEKHTIVNDNDEHPECCICDGRKDGIVNNNFFK